jgi:hypothetical protein
MATSPLFGWEEPDDVDLVKDGAAAIRTLGNAIDTSMGDLLGGTSGQVLSKNSNTNMDFTWVTPDDANAIQNAIVDAKGDLIAATGNDTPARLAVGTNNGETLVVDSTASTGLKWAPSSNFVGASVFKTAAQAVANGTEVNLTFDAESIDTNNFHSNTTNNTRLTVPTGYAGKYLINGTIAYAANATGQRRVYIFVNGSLVALTSSVSAGGATTFWTQISSVRNLSAGDYVELRAYQESGITIDANGVDVYNTNFSISMIGA